jgi:hypothetical protein
MLSSKLDVCSTREVGFAGATFRGSVSTMMSKSTSFSEKDDMSFLCEHAIRMWGWTRAPREVILGDNARISQASGRAAARCGGCRQGTASSAAWRTRMGTHEKQNEYSPTL